MVPSTQLTGNDGLPEGLSVPSLLTHRYFAGEVQRLTKKRASHAGLTEREEESLIRMAELMGNELLWAVVHCWVLERRWNARVPVLPRAFVDRMVGQVPAASINLPFNAYPWASAGMALRELYAASTSDPLVRTRRVHRFSSRATEYVRLGSLDFDQDSIEGLLRARPGLLPAMREAMPTVPPRAGSFVVLPPPPPPPPFVPPTAAPAVSTATATATESRLEVTGGSSDKTTGDAGVAAPTHRMATRSASASATGASASATATAGATPSGVSTPTASTGTGAAAAAATNSPTMTRAPARSQGEAGRVSAEARAPRDPRAGAPGNIRLNRSGPFQPTSRDRAGRSAGRGGSVPQDGATASRGAGAATTTVAEAATADRPPRPSPAPPVAVTAPPAVTSSARVTSQAQAMETTVAHTQAGVEATTRRVVATTIEASALVPTPAANPPPAPEVDRSPMEVEPATPEPAAQPRQGARVVGDQGAQGARAGSAGSSDGGRRRGEPTDLATALGQSIEIDELVRSYPYMSVAMQSVVNNHLKTRTTMREVVDQVARWVRDRNPDAPPRRTGSRAGSQVATRHRDEVEGLRGDLAAARRERDAAIAERDRARAELEEERRGRRRRREDSHDEDDGRGRSRRRYDDRDDRRDRRDDRGGGRRERW